MSTAVLKPPAYFAVTVFLLFMALYLGPALLKGWGADELEPYVTFIFGILALYMSSHVKWLEKHIPILITFIPGGSAWLDWQKRRERYVDMARKLDNAFHYYGVDFPVTYSSELSETSAQESHPLRFYVGGLVEKNLAAVTPEERSRVRCYGKVLAILYEEREREGGASIFKMKPQDRKTLAEILAKSGRLGTPFKNYFKDEPLEDGVSFVVRLLQTRRMLKVEALVEKIGRELAGARKIVEDFQNVNETYGLKKLEESEQKGLIRKLLLAPPDKLPETCAEELALRLGVSHQVFKILYRERKGGISRPYWPPTEGDVFRELASLLLKMPLSRHKLPKDHFRTDDDKAKDLLVKLLRQCESFQLDAFLATVETRVAASRGVVERMAGTVEAYAAITLSASRRIELTNHLLEQDPSDPVKQCAKDLAAEVDIPSSVLAVLYHERGGRLFKPAWPPRDEKTLQELAEVLVRTERLPTKDVEPGELARLLAALEGFKLEDIAVELLKVNELRQLVDSYLSFLNSHGLYPEGFQFKTDKILDVIEARWGSLPHGPEGFEKLDKPIYVLLKAGKLSIVEWGQGADGQALSKQLVEDEVTSFSLISIILYFTRTLTQQEVRKELCRILAAQKAQYPIGSTYKPLGILMAWSYLEAKQDFRSGNWASNREFLRLDEFLPQWQELVKERGMKPGGFEQELDTLQDHLACGVWLNNKKDLMWHAIGLEPATDLDADTREVQLKPSLATPAPAVTSAQAPRLSWPRPEGCKPLLKKLFLRLELETIERFLETHAMTPYVLTVRVGTGPVQTLLDCLSSTNEENTKRKQEKEAKRLAEALRAAMIEPLVDPEDARAGEVVEPLKYKYNFKLYTRQSRIGVLPKGMTFKEFCRQFRDDFQKAVDHRHEILAARAGKKVEEFPEVPEIRDYEILVHAFNPTGHNPFNFGEPGGRRLAMQRLKGLFAQLLSEYDLEKVLMYSEAFDYEEDRRVDLLKVLLANPIPEISHGNGRLAKEEQAILADPEGELWDLLLRELGVPDDHSVVSIFTNKRLGKRAIKVLGKEIARKLAATSGAVGPGGGDPAKVYLESVLALQIRKELAKALKVSIADLPRSFQDDEAHVAGALAAIMTRHISSLSRRDAEDLVAAITRHASTLSKPRARAEHLVEIYLERKRDQLIKDEFRTKLGIGDSVQELTRTLSKPGDADAAMAEVIRRYVPKPPQHPVKIAKSYRREVQEMTRALRKLELTIGHAELLSSGP